MFCLGCGTEVTAGMDACRVCGRANNTGRSTVQISTRPMGGGAYLAPQIVSLPAAVKARDVQAAPLAPSIRYGDVSRFSMPRTVPGRLVLAAGLLLAVDLLLPWVTFGASHIAPLSAPPMAIFLAVVFLGLAASVLYTPLRQRSAYTLLPLLGGAIMLGGGVLLLLLTGPFASRIVVDIATGVLASRNPPQALGESFNQPLPVLSGDMGLYIYLLGACLLLTAGVRMYMSDVASAVVPATAPSSGAPTTPTQEGEVDARSQQLVIPAAHVNGHTESENRAPSLQLAPSPPPTPPIERKPQEPEQPALPAPPHGIARQRRLSSRATRPRSAVADGTPTRVADHVQMTAHLGRRVSSVWRGALFHR